jgi:hypothetical protein
MEGYGMIVNGREYPMWSQFVEKKEQWIGGILEDFGDSMDGHIGLPKGNIITDIQLKPNGEDSAYFEVNGTEYDCGGDVQHLGISGRGEEGWLTFSGFMGHTWRILAKNKKAAKRIAKGITRNCTLKEVSLDEELGDCGFANIKKIHVKEIDFTKSDIIYTGNYCC